ncbi:MAG: PqqD family protein [Micropruina sp.]|nr:PqqD family protein [Micropruina sp.]
MIVTRTPPVDLLVDGDECLVLLDTIALKLSPAGSLIYHSAEQPISIDALTEALVAEFGEPAGSARLAAEQLVAELVGHGLLSVTGAFAVPPRSRPGWHHSGWSSLR